MQSRRHEDYKQSPSSKGRRQDRYGTAHDSYATSGYDAMDRAPRIERRSLSPRSKTVGSRRIWLSGEGRGNSVERREHGLHFSAGRTETVHSRSPSHVQDRKSPHFAQGPVHKKYEYAEELDYDDAKSNRMKQVYVYDNHGVSSRMSEERDFQKNRFVGIDEHMVMGQKSRHTEDGMMRRSYRVPQDLVPTSNYSENQETTGRSPATSQTLGICQSEHEKLRYHESINSDKVTSGELYREGEKPMYHSRDAPYDMVPTLHSNDLLCSSQFKEYIGSSARVSRSEFPGSYRGRAPFPDSDEYPRSNVNFTETVNFDAYHQRAAVRDHEASRRIMKSYPKADYSPKRSDHDDYLYTNPQALSNDDYIYPSSDLHSMMSRRSRLEYEYAQTDYEHRDSSKPNLMHHVADKIDDSEDSFRNTRESAVWEKQVPNKNFDTRTMYRPKHHGEYLGSGYSEVEFGFGPKNSQVDETPFLGVRQGHQISHLRSGFGRDAGPQFLKERSQEYPASLYDLEMQRFAAKRPRVNEALATYESSEKVLRRKYIMDEDINSHDRRTTVSSNWIGPNKFVEQYDIGEEWVDEGIGASNVSRSQSFSQNSHRKAKRTYDERDHPNDFASDDCLSSQHPVPHAQKHSVKYYKTSAKYNSDSLSWYNTHQTDRRSGIHRQHKIGKRNDVYGEDGNANVDEEASEEWGEPAVAEPSEDSEEFKQLVDEAFLTFSKKLNLNSGLQRRYKEQGKAGSLFCIVCGRSSSKDFMDTRRLVTHAYMSHKVGLRAHHLGLHKAICVLMGWSTSVPSETVTWVPEVLPDAEALAQKEDLMLWPPVVVIHNISMSNNNPEHQKVVPIEGVEAFLRGKGFVGGKIKVCLGKPADQSVILVKFLGTFTGIGNAEKLHKYFVENSHGREEFNRKISNNCKSSKNDGEVERRGDELEEDLLYGYIGIAEDLDRLDFNTKKWIMIKSKKEIQDLANAPVKADDR